MVILLTLNYFTTFSKVSISDLKELLASNNVITGLKLTLLSLLLLYYYYYYYYYFVIELTHSKTILKNIVEI